MVSSTEHDDKAPLSRRAVLGTGATTLLLASCAKAPNSPKSTQAPRYAPSPPRAPEDYPDLVFEPAGLTARLAVDKLTFGPTPGLVAAVDAIGVSAWIEQQLSPGALPAGDSHLVDSVTLSNDNAANGYLHTFNDQRCEEELTHATVLRARYSERQLYELMCDFWQNHFNIWLDSKYYRWFKNQDYRTVVRANAFGKFSDMLVASAKSPAMLLYLDNFSSNAFAVGGVNENYARELLELHTLGILSGQQVYTEADMRGVAKVMSGWTFGTDYGASQQQFTFVSGAHSREAVSILNGAWSRPARPDGNGLADGESLLRFLARHRSTARYLSWKLAVRFVSDSPSNALIEHLADVYQANDTAIVPWLRALFASDDFAASGKKKVRRPFEQLIAVLRALNASIDSASNDQAADNIREMLESGGQRLFGQQSPDGYPDRANYWVSTDGLVKRWSLAGAAAANRLTDPRLGHIINTNLAALFPTAAPGANVATTLIQLAATVGNFTLTDDGAAAIAAGVRLDPSGPASGLLNDSNKRTQAIGLLLAHPLFQRR